MEPENAIEALLLVSREPVSVDRLSEVLALPAHAITAALRSLQARYVSRGMRIDWTLQGARFALASSCADIETALHTEPATLSEEATEVLALIAYAQPITTAQLTERLEHDPAHVLATLTDAGLIEGSDSFRTTGKFLESCEIQSLDALPLAEIDDDDWAIAA